MTLNHSLVILMSFIFGLISWTGPWIWIEYLWPRGNILGMFTGLHFEIDISHCMHWTECTRLACDCIVVGTFVWSNISLQWIIRIIIKVGMIDRSFQLSPSGVSTESVITQQILREQLRWLMSWGTGNWLWVENAASGDGELESLLQHFLLSAFYYAFFEEYNSQPETLQRIYSCWN